MSTFTRDQVRKLSHEQQEALGDSLVERFRFRQKLLQRARQDTLGVGTVLLMGFVDALAMLGIVFPRILPVAIVAAISVALFLANRLNRRIDALVQLLDQDLERAAKRDQSNDSRGA